MTIDDENKIEAKIAHPRLFGGRYVNLNIINFERNTENDIDFFPIGRNPNPEDYYEKPEVQASDMIEIEENFEPMSYISVQGKDGVSAFADEIVKDNGNDVEISGSDRETINISEAGFNTEIHFGATKIKANSVTVVNETTGTTLTEDTDYEIDYYNGIMIIFSTAGAVEDEYSISYRFKNTPRNIAFALSKMPKMGGAGQFLFGVDPDYTGVNSGIKFTVFAEAVNTNLEPGAPDQAEITFDLRQATPVQV
jgi:hypothetical protein